MTPLTWAAHGGHDEIVNYLLDQGADVREHDNTGWTSLHLAVELGHFSTIQLLLDRGADPEARITNGLAPAHVIGGEVSNPADVLLLLERRGVPIDIFAAAAVGATD